MRAALLIGALIAGGFWYMTQNPAKGIACRDYILDRFRKTFAGRVGCEALAIGAAVNAYAESLWDPNAVGDNGASVGLFQLHENGLGKPYAKPRIDGQPDPTDRRFSPSINTDAVIAECERLSSIQELLDSPDTTAAFATYAFCIYVEKPADSATRGTERMALGERLGLI